MTQEVFSVNVALQDDFAGSDVSLFALKAPTNSLGGGITILSAQVVSDADLAAGTVNYWSVALHKYSNAGTPALNGTVAPAIGGTLGWGKGIPKHLVIDSDYQFVDAGEFVVAEYTEAGSGNPTDGVVMIQYTMGK